jgi:hemerythrin superfamily protein
LSYKAAARALTRLDMPLPYHGVACRRQRTIIEGATMRTSSTTSKQTRHRHQGSDALALLKADHEHMLDMFEQFEALGRKELATRICAELVKHTAAEEEIFYPAVRSARGDNEELVEQAIAGHGAAKDLIGQLMRMDGHDALFDAKVRVLSELIGQHIEEEEKNIFPKARHGGLDLDALGREIEACKAGISL